MSAALGLFFQVGPDVKAEGWVHGGEGDAAFQAVTEEVEEKGIGDVQASLELEERKAHLMKRCNFVSIQGNVSLLHLPLLFVWNIGTAIQKIRQFPPFFDESCLIESDGEVVLFSLGTVEAAWLIDDDLRLVFGQLGQQIQAEV